MFYVGLVSISKWKMVLGNSVYSGYSGFAGLEFGVSMSILSFFIDCRFMRILMKQYDGGCMCEI